MNGQVFLVVVLLGLGAANAGLFGHFIDHVKHEVEKHGNDLGKDLTKLTDVKQLLDIGGKRLTSVTAVGMSWSSCGGASDIIKINSMSLGPDPLHLPGTVQASFDITAGRNITNPVSVDLDVSVKKDPFGWIKIPCIDHKGSCKYDDVCPHTAQKDCPDVFIKNNIPCNCPFKEGHYVLPESNIDVDKVSIPSFLKNGEFKARARVTMGGQELVCVNVEFKLK